jgi:hypothetical protein
MNMFDDVLPPKDGPAPPPAGNMFDDVLPPKQGAPSAPRENGGTAVASASRVPSWLASAGHYAADIGHSIEAGADRGIAGLAGAPADALVGLQALYDWGQSKVQGRPLDDIKAESEAAAKNGSPGAWVHLPAPSREQLARFGSAAFERQSDQRYEPETRLGKFAKTGAEFAAQGVAFPGSIAFKAAPFSYASAADLAGSLLTAQAGKDLAKNVVKYGAIPGVASEAAGQVPGIEGTAAEPWARAVAGIGTGAALALGTAAIRPNAGKTIARAAGDLSEADRAAALGRFDALMTEAQGRGVELPQGLAWDAATNGVSDMAGLYRHAEALGALNAVNAKVAGQADVATRGLIDELGPAHAAPTQLGSEVADAARSALDVSPQGRAVAQAQRDAGPAVSPLQVGRTVETDLRSVRAAREAQRAEQAARDAALARSAPETVGMEGPTVTVERAGPPIVEEPQYSRPQFTQDAPAPMPPPPARGTGAVQETGQPLSLGQFIARNGGLAADGDVLATDLHRYTVPGYGKLVRPDGKPIDNYLREELIAKGYFRPDADGGAARDISSELLRKLQNEQRGVKSYPIGTDRSLGPAGDSYGQLVDEHNQIRSLAQSRMQEDLSRVGIDPAQIHPDIQERVIGQMARDPSINGADAYDAVVSHMLPPPSPRVTPTTVTEELPTVQFGQVDPRPAAQALVEQLRTAKGDVRSALGAALRDMRGPDGRLDMSVEGLRNARGRLDAGVQAAAAAGDMEKAAQLTQARQALDRQLKQVPEQAAADANFAANSRPLDVFSGNAPLGRVTAREGNLPSGRPVVPAEQVPSHLSGATAVEEALQNGGPATRRALEQRRVTQILGDVTDARGNVSAEKLRAAMRSDEHADVLALMPDARASLERIAAAQEARDALNGTLVGRLAERDQTTARAVNTLFPKGGDLLPGMEREVQSAVSSVAQQNPTAARQLVRTYIERMFQAASKDKFAGQNQMAGPKFRQSVAGNEQDALNLAAAVRGLPGGETIASGMERFLDVLAALGRRQNVGSRTAYNELFKQEMSGGSKAEEAARALVTGGVKLPHRIMEALDRYRLGKNVDELARLLTDPDAVGAFRGLVAAGNKGGDIRGPLARLVAIGARGAPIGGRIGGRGYRDAPLRLPPSSGQSNNDQPSARAS